MAEEQSTPSPKQLPAKKPGKQAKSGGGAGIAWLALLLALASAGGGGYLFWLGQQAQVSVQGELATLRAAQLTRDALNSELAFREPLQRQIAGLESDRHSLERQMNDLQRRQLTLQEQLVALGKTDRSDWLLAEAEYLLRLANQRLIMGRDIKASAKLLSGADAILVELDDAGLSAVRAAIAEERAALQTASKFDLEGLYLRVHGVAKAAEELTLFEVPGYTAESDSADEATPGQRWWQSFKGALAKLQSYIRIEQRHEKFQPLLAPEQEAALRYSLQLMFEQAQLAVLAGNEKLYQLSLERAADSVQRHYALDDGARQLIELVQELRGERLATETPDISGSLRLLKRYIESVHWSRETGGAGE